MKQIFITWRDVSGRFRYRFGLEAESVTDARAQVERAYPGSTILTARENNPELVAVSEVRA